MSKESTLSQNRRIYNWLYNHKKPMTMFDAIRMVPMITKLSTRIGEIERNGVGIIKPVIKRDWLRDKKGKAICRSYKLVSVTIK